MACSSCGNKVVAKSAPKAKVYTIPGGKTEVKTANGKTYVYTVPK